MAFFARLFGKDKAPPAAPANATTDEIAAAPTAAATDAVVPIDGPTQVLAAANSDELLAKSPATASPAAAPPVAGVLEAAPVHIKVPKFKEHQAFDGAVRIAQAPGGKAWRIVEDGREGQGFLAMSLMFIRDAEPAPLVLLAKIFTLTDGRKPNDPSTTDWRAGFASIFSEIDRVDQVSASQLTLLDPLPATEVNVTGTSADGECALCIRERRSVLGHEEFMVTAMGPRELFEQHAVRIDAWFASVVFVPAPDISQSE